MKPGGSLLRRLAYESEMVAQSVRFLSLPEPRGGWPVLLGISFPKSGTHLLDQILLGFARVAPFSRRLRSFYAEYEGDTGRRRSPEAALAWLNSLHGRDIASAHLFARPQVVARATEPDFVPYFIFRDPRDVVVSHVYYVTEIEPNHVHHDYYASLPDFDSRLAASILGRPDSPAEFPDIGGRFSPYLEWLDQPAVLPLRFEELADDRIAALNRILGHFLARVSIQTPRQRILAALESSIDPRRSPTFRSGKTGEWRKYFKPEHRRVFKTVAADLLVRLGYEKDTDW